MTSKPLPKLRPADDKTIIKHIRETKNKYHPGYGYRRMTDYLRTHHRLDVSEKQIYRIMKQNNLLGKFPPIIIEKRPEFNHYFTAALVRTLRRFQKKKGWTWTEIARELGVSRRTLQNWNANIYGKPKIGLKSLRKLKSFFYKERYNIK